MILPLPPTIAQLLHDAGYRGELSVARRDGVPLTDNDRAHLAGMMAAVEAELEDAKAEDDG